MSITEQFIKAFLFQCDWKLILILIIHKKMEECTFKNKLIGFLPYYWLIGFATRWFQNTRFYQSPILTLLGFAIPLLSHLEYFILKPSIITLI